MSALAAARNTPRLATDGVAKARLNVPMNGGSKCWAGGIVCIQSEGNGVPATATTGLTAMGRAEATVDNTAGTDGALSIDVQPGVFLYNNSASGDAITQIQVGQVCYLVDDQTVAKTSNSAARSAAGIVVGVVTVAQPGVQVGVWVAIGLEEAAIGAAILRIAALEA